MFDFDKNKNKDATLFEGDINKLHSKKKKVKKKKKSKSKSKNNDTAQKGFYSSDEDENSDSSDFYSDEGSDTNTEFVNDVQIGIFNFKWWEYLIFFIELALLTYAFLVFFNVIPIF